MEDKGKGDKRFLFRLKNKRNTIFSEEIANFCSRLGLIHKVSAYQTDQ